jgi:hypothetical protein
MAIMRSAQVVGKETMKPDIFCRAENEVGESPLWDETRNRLWWVDLLKVELHACRPGGQDKIHGSRVNREQKRTKEVGAALKISGIITDILRPHWRGALSRDPDYCERDVPFVPNIRTGSGRGLANATLR